MHVLVLMKCVRLVWQHREGIYWYPVPLRDEDQRSYKVRDVADVQAAPHPPVNEYVSDLTVGVMTMLPPCRAGLRPRSPHRGARGRRQARFPPP
jgi:hypothetical protein